MYSRLPNCLRAVAGQLLAPLPRSRQNLVFWQSLRPIWIRVSNTRRRGAQIPAVPCNRPASIRACQRILMWRLPHAKASIPPVERDLKGSHLPRNEGSAWNPKGYNAIRGHAAVSANPSMETLARWLRIDVRCLVNILPQRASIIELFKPTLYYLTPVFIAPRVILSGVKLR